jgi:hypothetical protein
MSPSTHSNHTRSDSYVIQVTGELGEHRRTSFLGMTIEQPGDGTSVITGEVPDQAALHGLLQRTLDSELPLIAVTRTSGEDTTIAGPPPHGRDTKGNQQ